MEATGLTRLQLAHGRTWCSPSLPRRGRDDSGVVLLQPLPQALVGRWPDQLEAHRAQADVDVGQLAWEPARRHLDLNHSVVALLEWAEHQGAALGDRRLERPEQVWCPEADVLDAFATLLEELAPLARRAGDRLDQLKGETRPFAPAVGDAQGDVGLRLAKVPVLEGEHTLIAVHDCVQVPHDDPDVKRHEVRWYAHACSPSVSRVIRQGLPMDCVPAAARGRRDGMPGAPRVLCPRWAGVRERTRPSGAVRRQCRDRLRTARLTRHAPAPPIVPRPLPQGTLDDPTPSCAACPAPAHVTLHRSPPGWGCCGGPQRATRAMHTAWALTGDAGGDAEGW